MVNRGRDLISQGTKPEDVLSRFQDSGRISGDDLSVLRARLERYSKETNAAEEAMSANPRDPSAVAAYDQAWNRETDWARAIKPAATEWHKIGQAMQGETDLFDGSFTGMRRMIREEQNRDVEPAEVPKLRQTAEKVQRASRAEAAARQRFQEKAGEITKNAKRMTPDELKAHFAERMKKLLPC
jgi:hypothetical protein